MTNKSCGQYYDFIIGDRTQPLVAGDSVTGEDRDGRRVNVAEILTTESGEHIFRVHVPTVHVYSAGDLDVSHIGKEVDVSGVSGTVAALRHYKTDNGFYTEITWNGISPTTTVPSASSTRVI